MASRVDAAVVDVTADERSDDVDGTDEDECSTTDASSERREEAEDAEDAEEEEEDEEEEEEEEEEEGWRGGGVGVGVVNGHGLDGAGPPPGLTVDCSVFMVLLGRGKMVLLGRGGGLG